MKYVVKGLQYEIPKDNYSYFYLSACDEFQKEYHRMQKEEQEEAQMQLEDGYIDDLADYDEGTHLEDYKQENFEAEIKALTLEMFRVTKDLPKNIVVEIDGDDVEKSDVLSIANKILKKEGIEVRDCSLFHRASVKDIANYNTYLTFQSMKANRDYQKFLTVSSGIRNYSFENQMLIYGQKKDASLVRGYNAWKKDFDRGVRKGAKRIDIYAPISKELKTTGEVIAYANAWGYAPNGKKRLLDEFTKKGKVSVLCGFRIVNVFDVTDTYPLDKDKDKLKDLLEAKKTYHGDNLEEAISCIKEVCQKYEEHPFLNPADATLDTAYKCLYTLVDTLLSTHPETLVGIKTLDVMKGEDHNLETYIAVGLISANLGFDFSENVNKGIALAMESPYFQMKDKQKRFEKMFDRGFAMAKDFEQKLEDVQKDKAREKKAKERE